ncbi:MAG: Gfo/Idh/MocA family oxidoreductase [Roseibium sp.]
MKVALIGLGMVAQTHVRAIAATEGQVQLKGVLSRDVARSKAFADSVAPLLGTSPCTYADVAEIAADPEIGFVIVCTPPNARADIVAELTAAGKPILMEKPIERTFASAENIVAQCEAANVPLGIVFQHRMRESGKLLAKTLEECSLGKISVVEIAVPWWRTQSYYDEPGRGTYARDGGGVLISQAIHTLDLALSLTGPVSEVQAMASTTSLHKMEAEDFVTAGLHFANGAVGSMVASTASFPGDAESIILHCEKGSAILKSGKLELAWHSGETESFGEEAATGGGADPMGFTHAWHQSIIEDFAEAVKVGRSPACSGREALLVHQLIDALVKSSSTKSAVTVPALEF